MQQTQEAPAERFTHRTGKAVTLEVNVTEMENKQGAVGISSSVPVMTHRWAQVYTSHLLMFQDPPQTC